MPSHPRPPGRLEIVRAIPDGSVRLRGWDIERRYLDGITSLPEYQALKPVARVNTMHVCKQLARRASYADGTTRRGADPWSVLAAISGTTWKTTRRRLEAWGCIGVVEQGATPEFAPMALMRGGRNRAAVYVLCLPIKIIRAARAAASAQLSAETRPPTGSGRTPEGPPRAREARAGETQDGAGCAGAQDLRHVARVMRKAAGPGITDGWCAWIWRPFAARWQPADLMWAIDHTPDGAQHHHNHPVRHPAAWLRARLGHWTDDQGQALESVTELRAAARERTRAAVDAHRAAMAAAAAAWTDPAPHAARIRAQMRWNRPPGG